MSPLILQNLAKDLASKEGLDPALICAIIEQESNWNPYAWRYEPAFYIHYVMPLRIKDATEAYGRAFSWGLMQVMGEVAREVGYKEEFTKLVNPNTCIPVGLTHFKNKLDSAKGDIHKALLLWNGGGLPEYPEQVLARVSKYN